MRLSSKELSNLLLYGHPTFTPVTNRDIVESTIKFIKSTRRFKTDQSSCQNLLFTIATLLFASSRLLSFFSNAQLLSICIALLVKIVQLLFFVNARVVETRYNLSFFYCSSISNDLHEYFFQPIKKTFRLSF